ncbi:MAG: terminase small subunit [Clostridia bacterium]|nr:terminase small subunit [Clostridia bacterium]
MCEIKLTPKREKFCQEMAKLGNQRQAYKNSFDCSNMTDESVDSNASQLMKDTKVIQRLQELSEEIKNENIADAIEIQETLTKLLRGEIKEECVVVEGCGVGESLASIVKKQVTPKDRIKAGETLAKMRGYFDLKIKVENVPIIIDDIK